jgi:hypothetical protein
LSALKERSQSGAIIKDGGILIWGRISFFVQRPDFDKGGFRFKKQVENAQTTHFDCFH